MLSKNLQYAAVGFIVISVILSGISLIPQNDWARFERTSGIASLDYTLSADFDTLGFEYHINTESSSTGGGIIGGVGGGFGSNTTLGDDWKTYPEVRGEVLENLGVLYDSYKLKSYEYELLMRDDPEGRNITWEGSGSPSAILNVSLKADLVPYWPKDSERPLVVTVEFVGTEIDDQLTQQELDMILVNLTKIRIIARTGFDPISGEYQGEDIELKVLETSESFRQKGDSYETTVDVKIPEGEDAVGFAVEIDAGLRDPWGRKERAPLSGKANPINIRPVTQGNIVKGAGVALAFPVILIGIILGIIGIVLIFIRKRPNIGIMIPAGLLTIIGPLWYRSGLNAAVEMLSERLAGAESGLEWMAGFYLGIGGGIAMMIAMILCLVSFILRKTSDTEVSKDTAVSSKAPVFREIPETNKEKGTSQVQQPTQFKKVEPQAQKGSRSPPPPPVNPFS